MVYWSGSVPTDKKFTGQRLDEGTGLYYYEARYYDPEIGRFISPDTLVPDPMKPQAFNRYSYVLNNPLIYIDPSGHVVMFYDNDKNIVTLTQAWELFMEVSPDQAESMMSDDTIYVFATNCINDRNIHAENTQLFGGDVRNKFQLLLVGTETISAGIASVTGTYAHEYTHIEEGNAGSTQQEDFEASKRRYNLLTSPEVVGRYGSPDLYLPVNKSIKNLPANTLEAWLPGSGYKNYPVTLNQREINDRQDWANIDAHKYSGVLSNYGYGNLYEYVGYQFNLDYWMMMTLMGY